MVVIIELSSVGEDGIRPGNDALGCTGITWRDVPMDGDTEPIPVAGVLQEEDRSRMLVVWAAAPAGANSRMIPATLEQVFISALSSPEISRRNSGRIYHRNIRSTRKTR